MWACVCFHWWSRIRRDIVGWYVGERTSLAHCSRDFPFCWFLQLSQWPETLLRQKIEFCRKGPSHLLHAVQPWGVFVMHGVGNSSLGWKRSDVLRPRLSVQGPGDRYISRTLSLAAQNSDGMKVTQLDVKRNRKTGRPHLIRTCLILVNSKKLWRKISLCLSCIEPHA